MDDRRLRVLVVDDHDVVHWGFRVLLGEQAWVERCLAARTGAEALELVHDFRPHVALVDLFLVVSNLLFVGGSLHLIRCNPLGIGLSSLFVCRNVLLVGRDRLPGRSQAGLNGFSRFQVVRAGHRRRRRLRFSAPAPEWWRTSASCAGRDLLAVALWYYRQAQR